MPAFGNHILDKGYDAAAALSQFRAVKFASVDALENPAVTPTTATTDVIAGVAQFAVSAGEITKGKGAVVRTEGITEWECSAAVTIGAEVSIASDGRCKVAATTERSHGVCVGSPTANAGERAAIKLNPNGRIMP